VGGGIDDRRPWLLSTLQAPVVALCRHLGPGNPWLLRGPHLLSAAISLGAAAALVYLMRRHFSATLALVGGALFVGSRAFVHYSAIVMTDLGVAGLCALTLALHLHAVRARKLRWFALAGVTFGLAAGMKFSAPNLVIAILATELASLVVLEPGPDGRRRARLNLDPRRRLGLVIEGLATVATFVAGMYASFVRFFGDGAWAALRDPRWLSSQVGWSLQGERWQDKIPMSLVVSSAPVLALAAAGALLALARPRRSDIPYAAWLLGMGYGLVFLIGHSEVRYLFPLVPPVIYFALRAVEAGLALGRRAGRRAALAAAALAGVLVVGALAGGVAQAGQDQDPVFTADVHGRAARALAARRGGSPAYILGAFSTLAAANPGPLVEDEFWNAFHLSGFEFSYELGTAGQALLVPNLPPAGVRDALFSRLADGDRVLRFDGSYVETRGLLQRRHRDGAEVWTVHRQDLAPAAVRVTEGRARLAGVPPGGPWWIYTKTPKRPWTFAGASGAGPETALSLADAAEVDGVALLRVDVERIE
jgi:hypothetical protein